MTTQRSLRVPGDLVEEVLCRVPATHLKRLLTTCKRWNHLFRDDRRFGKKHFDKAAKQFLPLVYRNDYRVCSLTVNFHGDGIIPSKLSLIDPNSKNEFNIHRVVHCDGLLLCTSKDGSTIVVWNPCTGERWIRTGNLFGTDRQFFLGYYKDNKSGNRSYKFLSQEGFGRQPSLIYDIDSDSWRIIDDVTRGWSIVYSECGISFKGNIYWIVKHETEKHLGITLLRFDFSTEKSQPVPLPYRCSMFATLCLSVVRDEKLSVLVQLDHISKTEIWVTNKIDETTKVVSWSKVLALDLSPDLQLSNEASFLLDEEKKVVMCCVRWIYDTDETMTKYLVYIVGEDDKVTPVELGVDTSDNCVPAILNYSPSLVQIKPAGGKRKRAN